MPRWNPIVTMSGSALGAAHARLLRLDRHGDDQHLFSTRCYWSLAGCHSGPQSKKQRWPKYFDRGAGKWHAMASPAICEQNAVPAGTPRAGQATTQNKSPAPANNDNVPHSQGPTAQKLWSEPDSPRSVRPLTELGGAGWVGRIEQAKQANQAGQGANQARHDASATPAMASTAICEQMPSQRAHHVLVRQPHRINPQRRPTTLSRTVKDPRLRNCGPSPTRRGLSDH